MFIFGTFRKNTCSQTREKFENRNTPYRMHKGCFFLELRYSFVNPFTRVYRMDYGRPSILVRVSKIK